MLRTFTKTAMSTHKPGQAKVSCAPMFKLKLVFFPRILAFFSIFCVFGKDRRQYVHSGVVVYLGTHKHTHCHLLPNLA